jgi:aminopeptidase N
MLRLPATATAVLLIALVAYWLAGLVGAQHKLAAIEPPPSARGDYRITLAFAPERFHQLLLQQKGRLVEVRGTTVFMKDVDPVALRSIARNYWVETVARWSGS